jgi:predicted PurR-regulated permease PerM
VPAALIPRNKRETWLPIMAEYDRLLSRYLRGQILEAIIVSAHQVGLMLLGFPIPDWSAPWRSFQPVPYLGFS